MTGSETAALTAGSLLICWLLSRPSPGQSLTDEWIAESRAETERLKARTATIRAETEALRKSNDALLAMALGAETLHLVRTVDPETGWTLWRNPNLRGVPDTVLEADGLRIELIGGEILCIEREGQR